MRIETVRCILMWSDFHTLDFNKTKAKDLLGPTAIFQNEKKIMPLQSFINLLSSCTSMQNFSVQGMKIPVFLLQNTTSAFGCVSECR